MQNVKKWQLTKQIKFVNKKITIFLHNTYRLYYSVLLLTIGSGYDLRIFTVCTFSIEKNTLIEINAETSFTQNRNKLGSCFSDIWLLVTVSVITYHSLNFRLALLLKCAYLKAL